MLTAGPWPVILLATCLSGVCASEYHDAFVESRTEALCPGFYCGRQLLPSGNLSACGACPRGQRANAASTCQPCHSSPSFYDCMYLLFMAALPLCLHWHGIDRQAGSGPLSVGVMLQHACALLETTVAAVCTVLLTPPLGQLHVRSCHVFALSDWYTLMFNPTPGYRTPLHCTQEAVYPLYSMVFVHYLLSLLTMLLLRPWLALSRPHTVVSAICAAMYFLPLLTLTHALLAGVLYAVFPHAAAVASLVSVAWHLAHRPPAQQQAASCLLAASVCQTRLTLVLLEHWLAHAFAAVALSGQLAVSNVWVTVGVAAALVPAPTLFYATTVRFTAPSDAHLAAAAVT